ncbi:cysteine desulfurase family protein [Agromyces aerolatus]|uniref:cysteine desulfurase family protein n=1 Tax=Agromyces sp. LY-1074 TaxID=3074080 RepID=UPI002855CE0A|nr:MULTISPECIES: cysteine desulfurase family protein [unclassified Agromyces]MDR5699914.1 cysteine desulfurase family protein [Agromyces sp. LY-1074]MDR5706274.1 cysteine desulfurase family protein [Agromyces sp. LY-1358]
MAYLDHAATTPMLPEAIDALTAALAVTGNPSSIHSAGQRAKRLLEESREQVAATLGADPIEVVFTGSGTEAVNLAIKGLYWRRRATDAARTRVLVPLGEHHATIDTVEWLAAHEGASPVDLPLDGVGRLRLDALADELGRDEASVALATMLWASNEVGTIQPVAEAAALAARAGVPMHADAIAAYGQVPIDVRAIRRATDAPGGAGLVAVSVSAHKIGGPAGIGALVLDRSAQVEPLLHGGGQQRRIRSGTQDVAAAAAFAAAATAVAARLERDATRMAALRDRLVAGVARLVPDARLSGDPVAAGRLPANAHFSFPGCEGDSLLFLLDAAGVNVSTGSACQAGVPEPSHVLLAMGRSEADARGALRITLGHASTDADVDAFLAALPEAYARASRAGLAARATSFDR